jgi:hypothetical protein
LYVTGGYYESVLIYNQAGKNQLPVGAIPVVGPVVQTDRSGNLYVADADEEVLEFPPGSTSPSKVFTGAPQDISDLAPCNDGTLYVAGSLSDVVDVYAKGSTSPTGYITPSGPSVACNAASDVYVAYSPSSGVWTITEYGPGGTGGKTLPMPGGYEVRVMKNDAVVTLNDDEIIQFYHPKGSTPYRAIAGLGYSFNLDGADANIWTTYSSLVYRISLATGKVTDAIPVPDGVSSVALSPPDF